MGPQLQQPPSFPAPAPARDLCQVCAGDAWDPSSEWMGLVSFAPYRGAEIPQLWWLFSVLNAVPSSVEWIHCMEAGANPGLCEECLGRFQLEAVAGSAHMPLGVSL